MPVFPPASCVRNRLAIDPHAERPLVGPLTGYCSVRLSLQDKIVYNIKNDEPRVMVIRARTHYRD